MSRERLAYAACAWALAFAAIGFYWAAGGTALLDTIGGEIERREHATLTSSPSAGQRMASR